MAEMNGMGRHPGEITRYWRWVDCLLCDYAWPRFFSMKNDEKFIYLQCPNCLGGEVAADREATREQWEEWAKRPYDKPLNEDERAYLVSFMSEVSVPRGTELDSINVLVDTVPERSYPLDPDIKTGDQTAIPEWIAEHMKTQEYLDHCAS